MSYYASLNGTIRWKEVLTINQKSAVRNVIRWFDYEADLYEEKDATQLDWFGYCKYREDDVIAALNALAAIATITNGEMEYVGEDNTYWRFLFKPETTEWQEQNGQIVYEDPDAFCSVVWSLEDLHNQMQELGIDAKAHSELTAEIFKLCKQHWFNDAVIETGNELIADLIEKTLWNKTVRVFDIEWEDDGEGEDLPSETELTEVLPEDIADQLSDKFGFLVKGFRWEVK